MPNTNENPMLDQLQGGLLLNNQYKKDEKENWVLLGEDLG